MSLPIIVLFAVFILLILLRVPVAISLGISSIVGLSMTNFTFYTVIQQMFSQLSSFTLMAIPGFVFTGIIMAKGGISEYLIDALKAWIGHIRGGMAVVTIVACMIFAAISGSSPATAAAIGSIMIPGMVEAGYGKRYSMGLVAAAGTLGILIPPSIPMIVYGVVSQQSISDLFKAGILPGIVMGLVLVISAIIYAKMNDFGGTPKQSWSDRWRKTGKAIFGLLLPVLILGSIYGGVVTPSEASFMAAFYAFLVSVFIYRKMTFKNFRDMMNESINITAMIYLIIAAAAIFGTLLTTEQVPQTIASFIGDSTSNKWVFLIGVSFLFFILGMFLEPTSITLITLPIFLPILALFDINLIYFAVIMTINMELGMITPPVGLNLFVVSGISREKVGAVVRGVAPFFVLMVLVLAIVMIFPQLSLFLVE